MSQTKKPSPDWFLRNDQNEWYTPPWVFNLVRRLGPIGLDPASNSIAQQWIKADRFYTKEQDGLRLPWRTEGILWLNPPYGKSPSSAVWIEQAIHRYDAGDFTTAIILVRGDNQGIRLLADRFVSCEPYDRIDFCSPLNASRNCPLPGHRFWYLGPSPISFYNVFHSIGSIRSPLSSATISV